MKPKFRIIECAQGDQKWYEVQSKGLLWGWNTESNYMPPFMIPIPISFPSYESAYLYVKERLPTKVTASEITKHVYETF